MHRRKSWNESGVSEVVGTILILAMTVVLFASIILWVSSFPTPEASIRLDMDGSLAPIYDDAGAWIGANITIQHRGGESLRSDRTDIILVVDRGSSTDSETLDTRGSIAGIPYGIDGPDADWDLGERWSYTNYSLLADDRVTALVVDTIRSLIVWTETLRGPTGTHPPLFVEKWADRNPSTPTIDVPLTNRLFTIFAEVMDPDEDLRKESVYVYLAFLYGKPQHRAPQRMYDDGTSGDAVADDGIFTAAYTFFRPADLSWDGGVILFNASDLAGHRADSRMTLQVQEGPPSPPRPPGGIESGRPPNLNYNGLQGFNIFNGTEWDSQGFNATDTRVFRESEEVVVVVGSALLTDTFGRNRFRMYDPFSQLPLDPVVYGTDKRVTTTSKPSSDEAFDFLLFENGYNIFVYRFELNNASSVGINFKTNPARPPQYFFSSYPVEFDIIDFLGNQFYTTDTIEIRPESGDPLPYPKLETFSDAGFTTPSNNFTSTEVIYVSIRMRDVDGNTDNVIMGNVVIQDFLGGLQVFRAPLNGHDANPPICPVSGACSGRAVQSNMPTITYRFAINLTLANQDPWVEGTQHYSLRVLSILDSNEEYSLTLSKQLLITSPLYRMDVIVGNGDTQNNAWGTHDVSYYFLNRNGVDLWSQERIHSGATKTVEYTKAISLLNFDGDNDLDVVASVSFGAGQPSVVFLYRHDIVGGDIVWTRSTIEVTGNVLVNDIRTGSLNKDVSPEIVVGGSNGHVWYYRNDGSWTKSIIDAPTTGARAGKAVNAIDLGDFDGDGDVDVVVARDGGLVTYYPNLDGFGRFTSNEQTDRWYAEFEQTTRGTQESGTYQDTWSSNDVSERLREGLVNLPAVSGSTANEQFNNPNTDGTAADNWTFAGWTGFNPGSATGHKHTTGGNAAHQYSVHMACVRNAQVGGYIEQPFTITVQGVTATFHLDWRVSSFGSTANNVQLYAFIGTATGAPTPGGANQIWTSGQLTGTTNWAGTPMVNIDVSARVQAPGTYYLKIGAITTDSNAACGTETVVNLDNAKVFWNRAAGDSSQLIHYYRLRQLPNRPGSTYTLVVEANRPDNAETDNFKVGFSTTGQFGSYANATFTINTNVDTRYSEALPSMPAATVWLRILDTDLTVGRTNLDDVRIDEAYVEVFTPGGVTGSDISLPGDNSNGIALDAGNYNGDAYDDAFVGTGNGNVFRLTGGGGGLQAPGGTFATGLGTIGGIKMGNVTMSAPGLEVAVASNTLVRIFRSDTGALLSSTSGVPNGKPITTLSMGDIDGDGDDDLMVGTDGINNAAANLVYYRNLQSSWARILINDQIAAPIYDSDVGDMNKAQFLGR